MDSSSSDRINEWESARAGTVEVGGRELADPERFEVVRQIGLGGMGIVYEGFDRARRVPVAIKTLRHLSGNAIYRFKKEFRALQNIDHPNLVRIDELVERSGEWFFTMEFVDGVDLLDYLRPEGAPPDDRKLRDCLRQLAAGIAALHDAGLVHRDIKPSNVLVTAAGRVVLVDFGLVTTTADDDASFTGRDIVGTAAYMAPEQALGRAEPASDWYSFGLILFELLVGFQAFRGRGLEVLMDRQEYEPPRPSHVAANVPPDLDALCVELLRREPSDRPHARRILERLGDAGGRQRTPAVTFSGQFTQSVPFVGRGAELEVLTAAFERARAGHPTVMLVNGESGVGKTELVHRFVEQLEADTESAIALRGRCYERETVPYKAFDGVADRLSHQLSAMPTEQVRALLPARASLLLRLFPVLRRVEAIATAPRVRGDLDPQELRARMFAAFRQLLYLLARSRCLVLVIDDLQWSDADSLNLLAELLHDVESAPLLVIGTVRTPDPTDVCARVEAVAGPGVAVRTLPIGALPAGEARKLAELLLPHARQVAPGAAAAVAAEGGGHPLFIQELARHVEEGMVERGDAGAFAEGLDDALWSRIQRLPAAPRRALEALAVAGAPVTLEVSAIATQQEPAVHAGAIALLRASVLVRTGGVRATDVVECYHDRVREAVLGRLDDATRRHWHTRLAIALDRSGHSGTDPHALVTHLEASGDAERAAAYAEQAAGRAADASAFDRAAVLYRTALRLAPGDAQRARELRAKLGQALINGGRGQEAAEALLAAADGADPAARRDCQRLAAEQLLISGHIAQGQRVLAELLAEIGESLPATPRRALASLLWYRLRLRMRGVRWRERVPTEIAQSELARLDVYKTVATGLNMVDVVRGADYQSRFLLYAMHTGEATRIARGLAHEACSVATQGPRVGRKVRALLDCARAIAERDDNRYLHCWVEAAAGIIAYFEGRLPAARDHLQRAESLVLEISGTAWELGTIRLFRIFTARQLGDYTALRAMAGPFIRDARRRGDLYVETTIRRWMVQMSLAEGALDQARDSLNTASWPAPDGAFHLQHWYELEARCELALAEQRHDEALAQHGPTFERLDESLLLRVQSVRATSRWLRGRLLLASAAAGDAGASRQRAEVRRLARRLDREGVPHMRAWAALLLAGAEAQDGHADAAVRALRRAAEVADDASAGSCAAAARLRRAALVGGSAGASLRADAEVWLRAHGIADATIVLRVLAPGFAP